MSGMNVHESMNYVELPAKDIRATQIFFSRVFGWTFTDYGPEYTAFSNSGLEGGFYLSELVSSALNGSALIVFYSQDLEQTQAKIESAGGCILQKTFDFPGGRRFHFGDPNGNEFAVWSDQRPASLCSDSSV